jgi:hypothetical protein
VNDTFKLDEFTVATFDVDADTLKRGRVGKVTATPIPGSDRVVRVHSGKAERKVTFSAQVYTTADYDQLEETFLDRVGTLRVEGYGEWTAASLDEVGSAQVDTCYKHVFTMTFSLSNARSDA